MVSPTQRSTMQTPSLPALYFSNDENDDTPTTSTTNTITEQTTPTLQTLPPELLHKCLTQFCDWGDLAKLACVQSKWKNIVHDSAIYGGREAMWELSMCLLHGDDKYDGSSSDNEKEENTSEDSGSNIRPKNNRGLQKNEALAIKYLTLMSGVEVSQSSEEEQSKSLLPSDIDNSSDNSSKTVADEAALLQLAECHLSGTGLSQPNPTAALQYLTKAYHLTNSVASAHKLALIYEYPTQSNNLIPIDVVAAFQWFKAASEKGHVSSMAELALCYELGCGVEASDDEALDWYRKAANLGHSASHYSVGEHFEEARGVNMDHEEACLWYYRGALLGCSDGIGGLRRLENVARNLPRRLAPQLDDMLLLGL